MPFSANIVKQETAVVAVRKLMRAENDDPTNDKLQIEALAGRLKIAVEKAGGAALISERSGVPLRTLHTYLAAGPDPKFFKLQRIANACGVSIEELSGRNQHRLNAENSGAADLITNVFDLKPAEMEAAIAWKAERGREQGRGYASAGVSRSVSAEPDAAIPVSPDDALPDDFVAIPHLAVRASAGRGLVTTGAAPEVARLVAFRRTWLRRLGIAPRNAELVEAHGDSMEPTIRDGDLMLIDRGYNEIMHGKIYALVVNELVVVKRVNILAIGGMMLISDNDRYPSETIRQAEVGNLNFQGRVAWYGRVM